MKLTSTDKHKHMNLEFADEILTPYLFFNMLILFNLIIIYGWNLQYPEQAKKKKIEEEIILEYEIKPDGSIGEINVIQGKSEILIKECKRVIENMPKWKPAVQKGKAISLKYVQKFIFKL